MSAWPTAGPDDAKEHNLASAAYAVACMIQADIDAGIVPAGLVDFPALHDYVDANDYTNQAGVPFGAAVATSADLDGMRLVTWVEDAAMALLNAKPTGGAQS
jgi:hypothetical protein